MFNYPRNTPAPDKFRFPATHRLTGKAALTAVLREGKRTRTKFLDVRAIASPLAHPRVGLIVPKRGRGTVDRNRLKRRLREIIRVSILPSLGSVDVVILTRKETYNASFAELQVQLLEGVQRVLRTLQKAAIEEKGS